MRCRHWMRVLAVMLSLGAPAVAAAEEVVVPKNEYNILIHYDLGMHCTGFDFSYCCVLPPYNSVLAQIVKTARKAEAPKLLGKDDLEGQGLLLWYRHEDNSYSEGNKLLYWNVPYDVNGNGRLGDPGDSLANAEFRHLYIYAEAPLGFKPAGATQKLYLGKDINIPMDHGPTGKPVSNGHLDYTGETGTIVYTTLNDGKSEVPIPLSQRDYWEALGLPLTPFFDSAAASSLRSRQETAIRPYQKAVVSLVRWRDINGDKIAQRDEIEPVKGANGAPVSFFGTNPIDSPSCEKCHGTGKAGGKLQLWKKEFAFWKGTFPDTSDYFARLKAAAISMLEIHDEDQGTAFLAAYNPTDKTGALISRLGRPSIICQDCHADNIVGKLKSATDARTNKPISALSRALHLKHLHAAPQPDNHNRTANCQTCHPAHLQSGSMARYPLSMQGEFAGGDIRDHWGGCYVGRDVHANSHLAEDIKTSPHLNAVGKWLKENVANDGKGLYCTNCHNLGSRLLFKADQLTDVIKQSGSTLRSKRLNEIIAAFGKMEGGRYAKYAVGDFFDPKVAPADRVSDNWTDPPAEPYNKVDDAGDYWLAAGEPHCADCHTPPFVEGMGGTYFPIDAPGKYSLMRYSKGHSIGTGHAGLSCQSCHESIHGLYPVTRGGPDPVSYAQAAQYNPDGSHGPLKCGACHVVAKDGVPVGIIHESDLADFPDSEYPSRYEKAVALAHTLRIPAERTTLKAQTKRHGEPLVSVTKR